MRDIYTRLDELLEAFPTFVVQEGAECDLGDLDVWGLVAVIAEHYRLGPSVWDFDIPLEEVRSRSG